MERSVVPTGLLQFPVLERGDGAEGTGTGGGCGGEDALVVFRGRVFGAGVGEPVVVEEGGFRWLNDGRWTGGRAGGWW